MALIQQSKENQPCPKYKELDVELVELTIKYFFFSKISIIYSNAPCEVSFAKKLVKRLAIIRFDNNAHDHKYIDMKTHKLNLTRPVTSEILSAFYRTKVFAPQLIIILCEENLLELILQIASSFSFLGYGNAWMVFHINNLDSLATRPLQFLNVRSVLPNSSKLWKPSVIRSTLGFYLQKILQQENKYWRLPTCGNKAKMPHPLLPIDVVPPGCTTQDASSSALLHLTSSKEWEAVLVYSKVQGTSIHSTSSEYMRLYKSMLHGSHLKIVSVLDPPFTIAAPHLYSPKAKKVCEHGMQCQVPVQSGSKTIWNITCCIGFSIDLIEKLSNENNFYAEIYIVEDGFYGALSNGRWDGMVGDVFSGKADLAVAGLTVNSERSTVIDFTEPFMRVDIGIAIPTNPAELQFVNFEFIKFLSEDLLWLIFATFVTGTILVYVFENEQFVFVRFFNPHSQPPVYAWREGFSYFSGLTFQRDLGGKNPHRGGARVTAIIFAFAMVIIMTTYTAVLTASKVKQEESNPFLGIKDPRMQNPSEKFKFATVAQTSIEAFFRRSPDPILHNMYLFMRKYNTPNTNTAIKRLLSGDLDAFINEYPFLLHYISKQHDCRLKIVGDPITQAGYGIALRKNSPWKHPLSQSILTYKEDGTLRRLTTKWLQDFCKDSNQTKTQLASLPLNYFGGAYILLLVSLGVSILLLGAEHIYHRYHRRVVDPIHVALSNWKTTRAGRRNAVNADSLAKWQEQNLGHREDLSAIDCSSMGDDDVFDSNEQSESSAKVIF